MNLKRIESNKPALRTNPKIIYVFEYCPSRTCLQDFKTISGSYIVPITVRSFSDRPTSNQFFNITDLIGLKLYQTSFIFLNKDSDDKWSLKKIQIQSLPQFTDHTVPAKLMAKYAVFPLEITNIHTDTQCTLVLCASFTAISRASKEISSWSQPDLYSILESVAGPLSTSVGLNDLVKISGKILNICDDDCVFELACGRCRNGLNRNYCFDEVSSVSCENGEWICEVCGLLEENEAELKVEMWILVSCDDVVERMVKVGLHWETISRILPVHLIKKSLRNESEEEVKIF